MRSGLADLCGRDLGLLHAAYDAGDARQAEAPRPVGALGVDVDLVLALDERDPVEVAVAPPQRV
jgi:hypothetical protein